MILKSLCTLLAGAVLATATVAGPLPVLTTAPGLESGQWNLWSDTYLAFLDNGDLHGLLANASKNDLRALVRQAQFSLETSDNATERGHLTAVRELLNKAIAGELPEAKKTASTLDTTPGRPFQALQFLPMKLNDTWWFKDANSNEDFTLSIIGDVTVNGVKAPKMKRSRPNGAEEWDAMTNDPAKGIDLHVRFIRGNNAVLTPPVHFADATTDAGKVHKTVPSFPNPATGSKTEWTVSIIGLENVTTPAGTFNGCMKVTMLIKDQGLGTVLSKIDLWVAPKVGFVKRVGQFFGVFFVETIQKYKVAP